jgi:putative oxidoreductase
MQRVIGRFAPQFYALMRIALGLLFACHGAAKLFGVLGGPKMPLASLPGLAGGIELVCGVLIAIGLLTSLAAFIASGEMAAAYFMAHAPAGPIPLQNHGELAAVYCFVFLYISSRGAGIWGIDKSKKGRGW